MPVPVSRIPLDSCFQVLVSMRTLQKKEIMFISQATKVVRVAQTLFAMVFCASLASCGGGSSPASVTSPVTTPVVAAPSVVSGLIQDAAGLPLAGASVSIGAKSVATGADGAYKFDTDVGATSAVVLVKKSGFATTAKEIPLTAGLTSQVNVKLFADQVVTTFNSAAAANVAVNGASVQIPASSLKYADGTAFTGVATINASYYSPDTVQGVQAFAGPYTGDEAGVRSPLISMGFVEVKLADATGRALQLKTGSLATLTLPASSNAGLASSIPLWFYDEATQIWRREGSATRQTNGSYQGTVAHFTLWNADFKGATATLKGCFVDAAGLPVTNVGLVGLRTTGWSQMLIVRASAFDASGNFTILNVPADRPLEFYSSAVPANFASVAIPALSVGEIRTLPGTCIKATAASAAANYTFLTPTTLFVPPIVNPSTPTTGTVDATTFAANYSGTYAGAEAGTFSVTVNSAGVVTGTAFSQTFSLTTSVSGQVSSSGGVTLNAGGSAGSAVFSGTITTAGVLSGNWNYLSSTTGGTFSGARISNSGTGVGNAVDPYVGAWATCAPLNAGTIKSTKDVVTITKSGATTFNWTGESSDYTTTNCTGTASNVQADIGTGIFAGTKLVGTTLVDKVIATLVTTTVAGGSSNFVGKTILLLSGTTLRYGDSAAALDAEGYPNLLAPYPAIKK
jgi:Carboxypeptidase regulatory-like domain